MLKLTIRRADGPSYRTTVLELPEREDLLAEKLKQIGVGVTLEKNCQIEKLEGDGGALQALVGASVNADEMQYLAKRLDSFDKREMLAFRAAATAEKLTEVKDLINLTYNLDCYTVISSFTDAAQIGSIHLTALEHGIIPEKVPAAELEAVGRALIAGGDGVVTPYGVLYRNGNQQELVYNGRQFPEYFYQDCEISAVLTLDGKTETLYLPCFDVEIEKALLRLGAADSSKCTVKMEQGRICEAIRIMLEEEFQLSEHLDTLNRLARCYRGFDEQALENFHTIFDSACPQTPEEVLCLAENFYEFTVIPGVSTPEESAHYMIEQSGHFELDPSLEEFLDFKGYGERRVREEQGIFGDRGYLAYRGTTALVEEILARNMPAEQNLAPEQGQKMGGL